MPPLIRALIHKVPLKSGSRYTTRFLLIRLQSVTTCGHSNLASLRGSVRSAISRYRPTNPTAYSEKSQKFALKSQRASSLPNRWLRRSTPKCCSCYKRFIDRFSEAISRFAGMIEKFSNAGMQIGCGFAHGLEPMRADSECGLFRRNCARLLNKCNKRRKSNFCLSLRIHRSAIHG